MSQPLSDPASNRLPTDRANLLLLVDALTGQPDILGRLGGAIIESAGQDGRLVAALHVAADTDASILAIHHTLGTRSGQAAAGNHEHTTPRIWRKQSNAAESGIAIATAEQKDAGIGDLLFTAKSSRQYLVLYTARVDQTTADASVDLRLRYTVAASPTGTPASPSNASAQLTGHSVQSQVGLPNTAVVVHTVAGSFLTGGVAQLPVHVAAFADLVTGGGGGTATIAQATGGQRQLIVLEGSAVG